MGEEDRWGDVEGMDAVWRQDMASRSRMSSSPSIKQFCFLGYVYERV